MGERSIHQMNRSVSQKRAQFVADIHLASDKDLVSDKLLVGSCCGIVQFLEMNLAGEMNPGAKVFLQTAGRRRLLQDR
jgi:hypothetical protein